MTGAVVPLGVVLAGGAGRRFGGGPGAKAAARLGGVTLAARAVATLAAELDDVVVCARGDTGPLEVDVPVWRDDDRGPRHPLSGIASALERSGGRPVLVLACDLPFVGGREVRALLAATGGAGGPRARPAGPVAAGGRPEGLGERPKGLGERPEGPGGRPEGLGERPVVLAGQPLAGVYPVSSSAALAAAAEAGAPVRATIAALDAVAVAVDDPDRTLFNVNTRADLATAAAMLGAGA